jgi:outer membrane protein assembly factor BamB
VALVRITLLLLFTSLVAISSELQTLPSAVRWKVAISAKAAAAPIIAGEQIVVALQSGNVVSYRTKDGAEAWHVQLRADHPVVADGKYLFIAAGEMIHALNADDGTVLWRAASGTLTAPVLVHGGWVIAASASGLAAFREADGTPVWTRESGPQHVRPTIEGDNLYVPLDDGHLLALDLKTGAERWRRYPAVGRLSEVLAFADRVFVGAADKQFYAYKAQNGEVDWRARLGTIVRGRPSADDSRLFVTALDNVVRAFDRRSGALLWHPAVPYRPTTGPVLIGSSVVVPGVSAELRAFDAATGRHTGEIKLEQALAVPPAFGLSNGQMVMAAITGSLTGEWTLLLAAPPAPQAPPE